LSASKEESSFSINSFDYFKYVFYQQRKHCW